MYIKLSSMVRVVTYDYLQFTTSPLMSSIFKGPDTLKKNSAIPLINLLCLGTIGMDPFISNRNYKAGLIQTPGNKIP